MVGYSLTSTILAAVIWLAGFVVGAAAADRTTEKILKDMARDYRHDATVEDFVVGFDVDGERWLLTAKRNESPPHKVELSSGFPDYPIAYWSMSAETLRRLDSGMTGETATQRARADDPRLMFLDRTENFPAFMFSSEYWAQMMEFKVHFFAKGVPEIVPLGEEYAVDSHGARIAGIHYAPKLSVFWLHIRPGDKVNDEADMETNPFETIWIATKGKTKVLVDGKERDFEEGNVLFIPKDVTHKFWNPYESPMEGVMILFGPGLNE